MTRPRKGSPPSMFRASLGVVGVGASAPASLRPDRPSLVLSLEGGAVDASVGRQRFVLDRTGSLIVPRGAMLAMRAATPSNRVAIMGFGEPLLSAVARRYQKLGLDRQRLDRWLAAVESLPRTVWLHEIVHRYVFEREVLGEHDNLATKFLEIEIVKEIYFLFRDREDGADRASVGNRYSAPVERAVAWIEAHLFERHDVRDLARRAGASESTILRSFRRELGCGPGEYWRARRLEESVVMLRAGRYSVAEIASRVGYENPTSFSFAFRRRFGRNPSAFLPARPTRRAP